MLDLIFNGVAVGDLRYNMTEAERLFAIGDKKTIRIWQLLGQKKAFEAIYPFLGWNDMSSKAQAHEWGLSTFLSSLTTSSFSVLMKYNSPVRV